MQALRISRERFEVVHREISEGSEPAMRFYLLVTLSTLIGAIAVPLVALVVAWWWEEREGGG